MDNSGAVFRLNCGSCRNPIGLVLMKAMSEALSKSNNHLIADWNNREQTIAQHADDLSKTLDEFAWKTYAPLTKPPWMFDIVVHDMKTGECDQAVVRIPGLGRVLP